MPTPARFTDGWGIPTPDVVLELPRPYRIPATGVVDYQHVIVHTGFTEDKWVRAAEVRPTDRSVVHHIIAFVRAPGRIGLKRPDTSALPSDFLVGYAPGQPPEILAPGQAKLIKAASDIVFQVHYTPNGKPTPGSGSAGRRVRKGNAESTSPDAFRLQRNVQDSTG
jgi:hypothetical protein